MPGKHRRKTNAELFLIWCDIQGKLLPFYLSCLTIISFALKNYNWW